MAISTRVEEPSLASVAWRLAAVGDLPVTPRTRGLLRADVARVHDDSAGLLERSEADFGSAIRLAEADLEAIQFPMLASEQRPAAVSCLGSLREQLRSGPEAKA